MLWAKFYQAPRQLQLKQESTTQPPTQPSSEITSPSEKKATVDSKKTRAVSAKKITVELAETKLVFTEQGGALNKFELLLNGGAELIQEGGAFFETHTDIPAALSRSGNKVISKQVIKGITFEKSFVLNEKTIERVELRFSNPSSSTKELEFRMKFTDGLAGDPKDVKENIDSNKIQILAEKLRSTVNSGTKLLTGANWLANDNRHFYAALIAENKFEDELLEVIPKTKTSTPVAYLSTKLTLPANSTLTRSYRFSAGGKSYFKLRELNLGLERLVDFGFIGGLGKFFLTSLVSINNFTHNFGWAIVILSLGIQLITLPLSLKSLRATVDMRKLQPHMKEIQQKFKDDPKRLNVEIMNLYKTHHVNPLSGCLPMLLQMPIFWALFSTLRNAFELRNAGWIFWIKDLSAHDPYYILPRYFIQLSGQCY